MFRQHRRKPTIHTNRPADSCHGRGVSNNSGAQAGPDPPAAANRHAHPDSGHPVANAHLRTRSYAVANDRRHGHGRSANHDACAHRHSCNGPNIYAHTSSLTHTIRNTDADSDSDAGDTDGNPERRVKPDSNAQDQPPAR